LLAAQQQGCGRRGDRTPPIVVAAAASATPAARAAQLRAALEANPALTLIRQELATLLPLQERASLLEAGLRYEPQAAPLLLQLGNVYAELGDVAQARSRLQEAVRLERFSRDGQNAAIASMARLAKMRQEEGDREGAIDAAEAAVAMYEQYRSLVLQVDKLPPSANSMKFGMSMAAKLNAAECLQILSRTENAIALLEEVVDEGDSNWQEKAYKLIESMS